MKQAEIQIGGVYVTKGKGHKAGERVRIVGIVPPTGEHPARAKIINLRTGKQTKPLIKSLQSSYAPEKLPQPVMDLKTGEVAGGNGHDVLLEAEKGGLRWSGQFDVSSEMDALYGALSAALDAVAAIRRKMS